MVLLVSAIIMRNSGIHFIDLLAYVWNIDIQTHNIKILHRSVKWVTATQPIKSEFYVVLSHELGVFHHWQNKTTSLHVLCFTCISFVSSVTPTAVDNTTQPNTVSCPFLILATKAWKHHISSNAIATSLCCNASLLQFSFWDLCEHVGGMWNKSPRLHCLWCKDSGLPELAAVAQGRSAAATLINMHSSLQLPLVFMMIQLHQLAAVFCRKGNDTGSYFAGVWVTWLSHFTSTSLRRNRME